jgi:hypothetical protein
MITRFIGVRPLARGVHRQFDMQPGVRDWVALVGAGAPLFFAATAW